MRKRPEAFDYLSTRDFVKAIDEWSPTAYPGYSRRAFAAWAGVASPNFISLIIDGKRPLRGPWLQGLAMALKLSNQEREHLERLSMFERARDAKTKADHLRQIQATLLNRASTSLAESQLEVLTKPLAWTLLQMLDLHGQDSKPSWFKKRLRLAATAVEIAEALKYLVQSGLARMERGRLKPNATRVVSPDQVQRATNAIYHSHVLEEAKHMLESLDPSERNFASLTASVPRHKIDALKAEVFAFGQRLLKTYAASDGVEGEVMRLNIQLYPLTKCEDTGETSQ